MSRARTDKGTTLVEAIIAIGILAGAVVALAGLSATAIRTSLLARERSLSTILARQKLEVLCHGVTSTSASGSALTASGASAPSEYLDSRGNTAGSRSGRTFVRRWSVTALPSDGGLLVIQVEVSPCRTAAGAGRCGDPSARAHLASIRSSAAW